MTTKKWINQIDESQAIEIRTLFVPATAKMHKLKGAEFLIEMRRYLRAFGTTQRDLNVARAKKIISTKS